MASKVVGEGTYGCVLKPPLKCDTIYGLTNKDYINKISKIMYYTHAINEEREYSAINNIEGLEKFAISKPILCNPLVDAKFNNSVKKCKTNVVKSNYNSDKYSLSMLLLEDGGLSIYDHAYKVFILQNLNEKKVFLTSLIQLFDGLLFFQSNNIIHRDIKLANMVYNVSTGKAKYIDFGLMSNFQRLANRCLTNKETLGISHSYYAPENSCSNKYSFNSNKFKCTKIKEHFKTHEDFISYLQKSFDIYSLSLALYGLVNILSRYNVASKRIKDRINPSFFSEFSLLLINYFAYDFEKRNINISELKENYINLLKKYDYYLKTAPEPSPEVVEVIEKIKKKVIKAELAKVCPPAKPILNNNTKRCVAECKPGFLRNKSFRCVKMNLAKDNQSSRKKHNTSKVDSISAKQKLCEGINKDYNHITRRCNVKCPKNKTRNSLFKCVNIN